VTCWKWFNEVLKEAGVEVTTKNEKKIDEAIHKYVGQQSSYGHCSADWRKARKEIEADPKMKGELVKKLQSLA
jgi:predicted Fe-Mo cluster-binding NifX family protein